MCFSHIFTFPGDLFLDLELTVLKILVIVSIMFMNQLYVLESIHQILSLFIQLLHSELEFPLLGIESFLKFFKLQIHSLLDMAQPFTAAFLIVFRQHLSVPHQVFLHAVGSVFS